MKPFLIFLSLMVPVFAFSQKIEKFYDYRGKETTPENSRYIAVILKTDSGWLRSEYYVRERSLKMKGLYLDSLCKKPNGRFYAFHPNQQIFNFGNYTNGKKDGLWVSYYNNGLMQDSAVYTNGKLTGTELRWHRNRYLSDSSVWNSDGSGVRVAWFDNGEPSLAGRYAAGPRKHGTWVYYHKNGLVSCKEKYDNGQLFEKQYFDEQGLALQDTTSTDRKASFKGGIEQWQRYLQKNLTFPRDYKIVNGDQAVVVVQGIIDESGRMQDVEVTTPFHSSFDRIALDVMRKSPDWIPAVDHNRKVKYYVKQPVTFASISN